MSKDVKSSAQPSSSLMLISESNSFLDSPMLEFSEEILENRIGELVRYKNQMLFAGFNTPFVSLLSQTREEIVFDEGEFADLKKQRAKIIELANQKRFSLNRVRVALSASRIALEVVRTKIRNELLEVLPTDGNYIRLLVGAGDEGIIAFRELMDELSQKDKPCLMITALVEYSMNGKPVRANLKIEGEKGNLENKVREIYGEGAKILSTKATPCSRPLIKKRSVRVCLASAYAALASRLVECEEDGKLREYNSILRKHKFQKGVRIDLVEGQEQVKKDLVSKGLMLYEKGDYSLIPELVFSISAQKSKLKLECIRKARELFAFDIFKVMLKPKRERLNSNFAIDASEITHMSLLSSLSSVGLDDAPLLVWKKLQQEHLQENTNITGEAFGAAFVFLNTDKDLKWCAQLGPGEEEIKKAAIAIGNLVEAREDKLEQMGLQKSDRGRKFAELIKKE